MVLTVVLGLALVCGTPRGGFAQTEAETAGREESTETGEAEPVEKLDEQLVTTTQRRTRSVSDAASSSSLLTSEEIQHLARTRRGADHPAVEPECAGRERQRPRPDLPRAGLDRRVFQSRRLCQRRAAPRDHHRGRPAAELQGVYFRA